MGADLYINGIADRNQKKYRPKFHEACKKRDRYFDDIPQIVKEATAMWSQDPTTIEVAKNLYPEQYKKAAALQRDVSKYYVLSSGGDGYFRCSYGSNFFSNIGLSWWQDFGPLLDNNSMLSVEAAIDIAEAMRNTNIVTPTVAGLKESGCTVDDGDNSPAEWAKSMESHKQEFIKFLETAIEAGEPIYCSI